ncbi:MAG: DUF1571 domain-containing protein [Planctomycetia bacterium]|nr:DUF1571 domain-containing protein [Planctomycetia bacterium]
MMHDSEKQYARTVWVMYGLCFLAVASVAMYTYTEVSDIRRAEKLHAFRPVEAEEYYVEYPPGWEFLKNEPVRREFKLPNVDPERTAESIQQIAQRMDEMRTQSSENRRLSPILRIHQQRNEGTGTFREQRWLPNETPERGPVLYGAAKVGLEGESLPPPVLKTEEVRRSVGQFVAPDSLPSPPPASAPHVDQKPPLPDDLEAILNQQLPSVDDVPGENRNVPPNMSTTPLNAGSSTPNAYERSHGLYILRLFNKKAQRRLQELPGEIRDYTCILYKWDETNVASGETDVLLMRIREEPFSVYARFLHPHRVEGREWILWENHYDGKMVVNSGPKMFNRTLMIELDSPAIRNSATRSIRDLGFESLLEELVRISNDESSFSEAIVRYYNDAKVGERSCYALEVSFERATPTIDFHKIEIFIDKQYEIPTRLVIYDWSKFGEAPKVRESYTYIITGINNGATDFDFCFLNPAYNFKKFVPRLSEGERVFMERLANEH